ncbi:hypothetical protein XENOCAPTIV_009357 [Xenoophorus captivus]|uniref:Uncharacterized protein n=1 Tax=Xenoophorus captivus TaxID=1517983 RepID=A0ABV0RYH7_9TELE
MRRPTHLRPFHHRGDADSELPLLRLSSDPDEYSSSEQSCDTVIYVGPNGAAVSDRELTDNEGPPEFVPIEVVEEAELAQTMIHSLAQVTGCPMVTSSRNINGNSSSIISNPLHKATNSQLHDRFSLSFKSSAAAVSVGGRGPLLPGEDEVVYAMACRDEEDIVVTDLVEDQSLVGRPVSIISFNSDCGSEAALALESQPICIRSDAAVDGAMENYHLSSGLAANTGVKEVVAKAEVGGAV